MGNQFVGLTIFQVVANQTQVESLLHAVEVHTCVHIAGRLGMDTSNAETQRGRKKTTIKTD